MSDSYDRGLDVRRRVMGDDFVDRALNSATELTEPLQRVITEHCWGAVWTRETLPLKTRSMITIAILATLKSPTELKGHIRGALNNGCTPEEIREILLHTLPYIGAPATQEAFRAAKEVLESE